MTHRPSRSGAAYRHRRTAPVEVRYLMPAEREPASAHQPVTIGPVRAMAAVIAVAFLISWAVAIGGAW